MTIFAHEVMPALRKELQWDIPLPKMPEVAPVA